MQRGPRAAFSTPGDVITRDFLNTRFIHRALLPAQGPSTKQAVAIATAASGQASSHSCCYLWFRAVVKLPSAFLCFTWIHVSVLATNCFAILLDLGVFLCCVYNKQTCSVSHESVCSCLRTGGERLMSHCLLDPLICSFPLLIGSKRDRGDF